MRLLRCIARAVLKNGGRLLCDLLPAGQALYDVAADPGQPSPEGGRAAARRAGGRAPAQAPAADIQAGGAAAVAAVAAHEPPDLQLALVSYLTQVPAAIRRSLKRPSDPDGRTLP